MAMTRKTMAALTLGMALGCDVQAGSVQPEGARWVTSWYAAPQPGWDGNFILPMNVPEHLDDTSVRETVRLSAGGRRVRLVFSNRYGSEPVALGGVRIGLADGTQPGPVLAFSGKPDALIPPGADLTSDAVALAVPALARMTVTSYLPRRTAIRSFHWGGQQTLGFAPGNTVPQAHFPAGAHAAGRLFLSAVMVDAPAAGKTVVVLGDSITDGNGSTPDADRRWPDFLAERVAPYGIAVANAGISGARLLKDGMGRSALARFEQDVLGQPAVSDVIVLLGTNDIGWPGGPFAPSEPQVTLDELAAGYRQLVAAAHVRGVRVTAGTLPPFEDALEGTPYAGHYSPEKESLRRRFNRWILSAGVFDAVVDFDAVLRDPARPQRMHAGFDSGDHLHPGDAGYRAMAAAVDIAPLTGRRQPAAAGTEKAQ